MSNGPQHIASLVAEAGLGEYACRSCGSKDLLEKLGPHPGGHHAKLECRACGAFVRWMPKPIEGRARRRNNAELVRRYGRGYCEMCRRKTEEIPLPEVLEAHHVVEVNEGGGDERTNVWIICTWCHASIHQRRTYLGHYCQKKSGQEAV